MAIMGSKHFFSNDQRDNSTNDHVEGQGALSVCRANLSFATMVDLMTIDEVVHQKEFSPALQFAFS